MSILLNEKINFKSLEENTLKIMMKLGKTIIEDELRQKYNPDDIFKNRNIQPENKIQENK